MNKLKECRYGVECYRINADHLKNFDHPHLETILKENYNATTKSYNIPDDIFVSNDIILKQLETIKSNLFSKTKTDYIAKSSQLHVNDKPTYTNTTNNNTANVASCSFHETNNINMKRNLSSQAISKIPDKKLKEQIEHNKSINASVQVRDKNPKAFKMEDYNAVIAPQGQMITKLRNASPYNIFLTSITDSKPTYNEPLTVTFQELMDESLGEIESSVQINYLVEIGWLSGQYFFAGNEKKPLLILYGMVSPDLENISVKKPNITAIKINMNGPFGIHHTKMMMFGYKDGSMRVIVSTANLYEDDWENRTQGIWISPKCKPIPDDADTEYGDSPTGFRESLLKYLGEYKLVHLQPWIARIRKSDFSQINVFLICSVPGSHRNTVKGQNWGHPKLGSVLEKHCAPIPDEASIITQSSSIGSLGPNVNSWIMDEYFGSLKKDSSPVGLRKIPEFKMIYPSFSNVLNSHDQIAGGGCLPYSKLTNVKQLWLKHHLYQWKSRLRHRNQAMPHIKSYCRYLNDNLYWFHLTSANLSKAAWGMYNKSGKFERPLRISNYEAGVLFLPRFIIGKDYFPLKYIKNGSPIFPMPYDLPLTRYIDDDIPFQHDL